MRIEGIGGIELEVELEALIEETRREARGVIVLSGEQALEFIKSSFSEGLLVITSDDKARKALYIDTRDITDESGEGPCLVAGWIKDFNPYWGCGSHNANALWTAEKEAVILPPEIENFLWPIAGSEKDFFKPSDLEREVEEIGVEKVVGAIKTTIRLLAASKK